MCMSCIAFADTPPAELDIHKFQLGEITYVGFLEKDAQTLLQYRMDNPKLQLKIEQQDNKIKNNQLQIATLTSANTTLLDEKKFLVVENIRLQKELDNRNAWYRNPYFAFCVGLVLGTATVITVVYCVK